MEIEVSASTKVRTEIWPRSPSSKKKNTKKKKEHKPQMSTYPVVIQKGWDILVQVGGVYQLSVYGIYTPEGYSNELQWDIDCGASSM